LQITTGLTESTELHANLCRSATHILPARVSAEHLLKDKEGAKLLSRTNRQLFQSQRIACLGIPIIRMKAQVKVQVFCRVGGQGIALRCPGQLQQLATVALHLVSVDEMHTHA